MEDCNAVNDIDVKPDLITLQTNTQIPKCVIKQEITHVDIKKEVEDDDNFENYTEDFLKVEIKTEENDSIKKELEDNNFENYSEIPSNVVHHTSTSELSNMSKKTRKIHCCVPLCESYLQRGNFQFPTDMNLKAKWLAALNLKSHGPRDTVCFKHFREKFDYCMQPRLDTFIYKLSSDAVPSLCLPLKSHLLVNEKIEAKNNHKQRKIQDNTDF